MKIYKIFGYDGEQQFLKEEWKWDGKFLTQIDFYKRNGDLNYSHHYVYDKNRVVRVEAGDQFTEFVYEKNTLKYLNTYAGEQLIECCTLNYTKGKLTQVEVNTAVGAKSSLTFDPLRYLLPMDVPMLEEKFQTGSGSKASSIFTIDLVWDQAGKNIQFLKYNRTAPDQDKFELAFIYDDKKNPFHFFMSSDPVGDIGESFVTLDAWPMSFVNENNVLASYLGIDSKGDIQLGTLAYDYSNDYPTVVYKTNANPGIGEELRTPLRAYRY